MTDLNLNALRLFVKVVEAGSFVGAAKALGIPKTTVSRRLSELEAHLEVRLLQRDSRRLSLSPEGTRFYNRCQKIISDIDDAVLELCEGAKTPGGPLRVTCSPLIGESFLGEWCLEYLQEFPNVNLELSFLGRKTDLIEEGFDVAIRAGIPASSNLIARKFTKVSQYLCASPSYLEEHNAPLQPAELSEHKCISYNANRTRAPWTLHNEAGDSQRIDVSGAVLANSYPLVLKACTSGHGIASMPAFLCCEELRKGSVVRVLPKWSQSPHWIFALYPSRENLSVTMTSFLDFLSRKFSESDSWS